MVAGIASAQDVIEISTVDQLKEFRDAVNGGNGYAGKTVKLTADLDLSSEANWKPIGNLVAYPGQSFNGTFDGGNHVISNLTVNDNTPNHAVAALFGSVVNGTVKNLTVKDVNIQSTHYAAGIVAYTSNGPTIENCKVIGGTIKSTPEIINGSYDNGDKVGGIMGYATAGSTINNCWVEGVTITGYRDLGGIAGYSNGSVTNNTVKNVTIVQDKTNGYKNPTPTTVGDIVGGGNAAATAALAVNNNIVIKSEYVAQIGETQYETLAAAVADANAGDVIEVIKAGDYTLPSLSKNVTVEGAVDGVVFTHTTAGSVASVPNGATFKNVKFVFGNVNYHGFQHAGTINMEGCTLDGLFFSYGDMNFTNCKFTQSASDYHMWCYSGDVTYTGCTFTANKTGKFLNIYNEDGTTKYTVTVENCKFVNTVAANKAALNVKATCGAKLLQYDVIVNNCTTEGNFPEASTSQALVVLNNVVQVDDRTADGVDNIKVWQDDVLIYPVNYVAQIGETKYETLAAAVAAANMGDVIEVIKAGDYTLPNLSKNVTVEGAVDGVVFTHTTAGSVASIPNGASFKNVKFVFGNVNYHGFQHAGTINMEGCTLDGLFFSYGDMNFTNCEFTQSASDYHMWCYSGNVTYTGCTFTANKTGKFLNIYNEDGTTKYTVTVENCKFVNNVAANKAALNVKATCGAKLLQYDVIINNCTTEGSFPEASTSQALVVLNNVVQVDDRTADGVDNIKVWQDDVLIYPVNYVAQIGETKYETLAAAVAAANAGDVIKVIKAGDYTLPNLSENVTVEGAVDGVVFTHTTAGNVASIPNGASFKNVKFVFGNVNYHGFQHASTINMENCTLDGKFFSYGDMNFTNCKFTQSASDYHMWCYSGNVTYTGCTFTANGTGKFLNIYNEDGTTKYTVTVENCKFVNNVAANKAALNVKATCKGELLQFDVIVKNCTTEGSFPAESTSQALVVLNNVVQVDDRTADGVDNIKVWQDGVLIYPVNYVAQIGDVKYETLQAALDAAEAADAENFVIDLLADAELDITAWDGTKNPLSIGTVNTQSITINGNNHKLTFNHKNSDWNNVATMNDAQTKLVLNNMTISNAGHNNSTWNRHDINFNCAVELNNVTSDKALAFKNDATLKNVTISDNSGDIYAVWISPRGQKVDIDGLTINCGRGIKIDDEYVDTPSNATLNIANATFNTTKKSAILVKNNGETTINAREGINIEHAAADMVNPIWVDEDKAEEFYKVTVTGANVVPEKKESDYVACLMKGEQRWGYYKGTDALSRTIAQVEEGWSIKLHQTTTEAVEVSKPLVITKNGCTADNVTAGEGFVREENDNEIIIREASYVAQIGDVKYETLQAALDAAEAADTKDFVIELLADAELDIKAWDGPKNSLSIGTENTQSITINGNNHKLTFNQKDSDWNNVATMNDAQTKLVLNDMTISSAGYNNGPWNRHDINFNCAVELNNVTSDKALAFKNDATLKNVTISDDSGDIYAVWISPRGQKVDIDGLTINCGRGIKIDDEYSKTPYDATLNIANATFNTTKKSAILVKNNGETTINAGEGINIEHAAADTVNPIWVDEDKAEEFYKLTVTGANVVPEKKESDYVVCLMKGEQRWGYYKGTDALSRTIAQVEEGWSIKLHQTTTEAVEVSKPLVITKNGFTADNVTAGEGFVREETDDEIIIKEKAEEVLVELIHGVPYPYPEGKECTKVTYKRTFASGEVDHYRSWYVPFDYTVSEEDLEKFKFYKIHMIAGSDQAGEVSDVTNINIYITKVEAGTKLVHNKPYVIVPKEALTDHVFTAENVDKVYAEENGSRLHVETAEFNYDFYGTYREYGASKPLDWYALNKNGAISPNATEAAKLQSYVWALKVTPRNDGEDYSNISFSFVEGDDTNQIMNYTISEDNEIEGIYTVNGMKVDEPVKGVNIIRFMDGKTKKIYVK